MSTAWLQRSSNRPLNDSSTVEPDPTRIRAEPPPDVDASKLDGDDHVEEMPIARLIRTHTRTRTPASATSPPHSLAAQEEPSLPIVALTIDSTFAAQLRSALDTERDLQVVETEDSAAELAAAGRCPILVTDKIMPRSAFAALSARLRAHDATTIIIVSGNRDQGSSFIGLQSSGVVDGFLLKPVTAASTQLVLEAATRRHRSPTSAESTRHPTRTKAMQVAKRDIETSETIETHLKPRAHAAAARKSEAIGRPRSSVRVPWSVIAVIGVVVAAIAWWLTTHQGIDAEDLAAKHLALADDAYASGHLVDARDGAARHYQTVLAVDPQNFAAQRGLDRVAAELSRITQAHMSKQNLPEAVLTLQRLRELQPDYPELPLLDAQLQSIQNAAIASHAAAMSPAKVDATIPTLATIPSRVIERHAPSVQVTTNQAPTARVPTAQKQTAFEMKPDGQPTATHESRGARIASPASTPSEDSTGIPSNQSAAANAASANAASANAASANAASANAASANAASANDNIIAPAAQLVSARIPVPAQVAPTVPTEQQPALTADSSEPQLLKYVPPTYPSAAFNRGMEGWIRIGMEITPAGDVINARIEDGEKRQLFGRAALAAVRQWKYVPDAKRSMGAQTSVRLEFKMDSRR